MKYNLLSVSVKIKVRANEHIDVLVRRLRKACEREGMHREIKRKEFYEKPSEIKRRKSRQNVKKTFKPGTKFVVRTDKNRTDNNQGSNPGFNRFNR